MGGETSKTPSTLTPEPWTYQRTYDAMFTKEYADELKKELKLSMPQGDTFTKDKRANILVLGPVKAGKSSFLNSIASVIKGRLAAISAAGEDVATYTNTYTKYSPTGLKFSLHDCMGIERNEGGFNLNDILFLVNGNIPKNYQFNAACPISDADPLFIQEPREEDKIHCVIYVIDAEAVYSELPRGLLEKIECLQGRLKQNKIPRMMVLTKVDRLCDEVRKDIRKTFRSVRVRDMVRKASELFKLPPGYIFPIKNHGQQNDLDHNDSILILLALKQACGFAEDYIEQQGSLNSASPPKYEG